MRIFCPDFLDCMLDRGTWSTDNWALVGQLWKTKLTFCQSSWNKHRKILMHCLSYLCHFYGKIYKNSRKAPYIILLDLGRVPFRFHDGRTPKTVMFMIFGFSDVSMTSRTNLIHIWRHRTLKRIEGKPNKICTLLYLEIQQVRKLIF